MAKENRSWTRQGETFWRAHHEAWKRSWYYLSTVLDDFSRYIVAWKALPHHVRFRRHGHARPGARDIGPRFAPPRLPQRPSPVRSACPITLVSLSAYPVNRDSMASDHGRSISVWLNHESRGMITDSVGHPLHLLTR